MRRATACLTLLTAIAVVVPLATPAVAKSSKISPTDACTIVTARQVSRFGKPVGTPTQQAAKLDCAFPVGQDPTASPGGTFTALILYPNVFAARVADAQAGLEDQFAIDKLSGQEVEDAPGLGTSAFFNGTNGYVAFAPTKKIGIILRWQPSPAGTPMSKADKARLLALAKIVSKRAKG